MLAMNICPTIQSNEISDYTTKNGENISTWRPSERAFKIVKDIKNLKFKYSFNLIKGTSIIMKLDMSYHKSIYDSILHNVESAKEILKGYSGDVSEYEYSENKMFYNNKLNIWINKIKKNENDRAYNPLMVKINENEIFFNNVSDFYEFVNNKQGDVSLDMFFELSINHSTKNWSLKPILHSITFLKEPSRDMSILTFNKLSFEEQIELCKDFIQLSLEDEKFKEMKIPSFVFRGLYFKFPSILFDEDSKKVIGKKFQPNLWLGKKGKYDENSNAKESLIILANDEIKLFMENIQRVLENYIPQFYNVLTKKMKLAGMNIKLSKKDSLGIKTSLVKHEEVIIQKNEDDEEEIIPVENSEEIFSLNIKQPYLEENADNDWVSLPNNLRYSILYPNISINKLWYDDKDKNLNLQICISKYIKVDKTEASSGHVYSD